MGRLNSNDGATQVAHELEADGEQDAGDTGASNGRDALHRLLADRGEPAPGEVADLLREYPEDTDAIMGSVQDLLGNLYASRVAQAGPTGNKKKKKQKSNSAAKKA